GSAEKLAPAGRGEDDPEQADADRGQRDRSDDRRASLPLRLPASRRPERAGDPHPRHRLTGATGRAALERAKARLDLLDLYPDPVGIDRVRVFVWPWLFRLPWFRRFDGYAAWGTIVLRRPVDEAPGALRQQPSR